MRIAKLWSDPAQRSGELLAGAVRLWGTVRPVPVTVPERLITRKDAKGRVVTYVAVGVGPA